MKLLDKRIHFALNCGSESCPPILYYTPNDLNSQLEQATKNFLNSSEVKYLPEKNEVHISKIFYWYKGDFHGNKGVIAFFKHYKVLPEDVHPKIIYQEYNWNHLEKFEFDEEEEQVDAS